MKLLKHIGSLRLTRSASALVLKERKTAALFLVHCSVLVIFCGAFLSKTLRYERYYRISPGEAIVLPQTGDKVVLNDFTIEYYPGTFQPKEYRSRVCLPERAGPVKEYDIRVNHPLVYRGYSLYQSSFEITAEVEIKITKDKRVIWEGEWQPGDSLGIPGDSDLRVEFTCFLPDVYEDEKGRAQARMDALRNPAMDVRIYNRGRLAQRQIIFCGGEKRKKEREEEGLFGWQIENFRPRFSSILQVVKDPGVVVVWTGFIMLFLGLLFIMV